MLVLVMGVQLGFIFWLGSREPMRSRPPAVAPGLLLANSTAGELLALTDPTLFALPHLRGFSGLAWLRLPSVPFRPFTWSEPPRWMNPDYTRLTSQFAEFLQTNHLVSWQPPIRLEPELSLPNLPPLAPMAESSNLTFEGALAKRRLLQNPSTDLPAWPSTTLLSQSVVQLLVDAEGHLVSATLLKPGSGLAEADRYALDKARSMVFEPVSPNSPEAGANPLSGLAWGQAIFQWHTTPVEPNPAQTEVAP